MRQEEAEEEDEKEEATDIKSNSNNPHLAGGEQDLSSVNMSSPYSIAMLDESA